MPEKITALLKKHHYSLVGSHSAVKLCLWTKKAVQGKGFCYKQKFYGIQSHRCMQCTPAVAWCSLRCQYCWRPVTEATLGTSLPKEDEPEEIAKGMIAAQRKLLSGLGGVPHDEIKLREAMEPNQVALSLAGEPCCYSRVGELINIFKKRGMTTFLVTNGTFPERLASLSTLPWQLYVSLCANSESMFQRVHKPLLQKAWEKLLRTLEILPQLNTRKVIRLTLVRGLNMKEPEKYAALIAKAEPTFVECKAFMSVGFARARLPYTAMPLHKEIKEFAEAIAAASGYKVADEKADSRVVLLKK